MGDKNSIEYIKRHNQYILKNSNGDKRPNAKVNTQTLIESTQTLDGKYYGIIKEFNNYYIKVSESNKEKNELIAEDFDYIGGLQHKPRYKHESLQKAENMFNLKIKNINENIVYPQNLNNEAEIPKNSELDKSGEKIKPNMNKGTDAESSTETPSPEPEKAPSTSSETETIDTPSPEPEKAPEEVENADETPSEEESKVDSSDDSESSDEDTSVKEINSLLGKISGEASRVDNIDSELTKRAINTIISSFSDGFEQMDDKDKEKLIKRIERDGQKIEESINSSKKVNENNIKEKEDFNSSIEEILKTLNKKGVKPSIDNVMMASALIGKKPFNKSERAKVKNYIENIDESTNKNMNLTKEEKEVIKNLVKEELDLFKLEKIILEEFENHKKNLLKEEQDDDYYEVKLQDMVEKFKQVMDFVEQDQDIPAWIQEKLVISKHNADSLFDYYRTKMKSKEDTSSVEEPIVEPSDGEEVLELQEETTNQMSTDLEAAKEVVKDVLSGSLNENIMDKLKKFSRPVILAAFLSLMSNNIDAAVKQYTDTVGDKPSTEMVQKAKEIANDSSETKETETKKNNVTGLKISYSDDSYKLSGSEIQKLNKFIKEYCDWKAQQPNKSVGDDVFFGIIGKASTDPSKAIAAKTDVETAIRANEYLAKLRAKAIFDYTVIGITKAMRAKNIQFKYPSTLGQSNLESSHQMAIGYKVMGEDDPNQSALVLLSYGDKQNFAKYKDYVITRVGTRQSRETLGDDGSVRGVIKTLDDFSADRELYNLVKSVNK